MMISMDKKYKYRNGEPARILCIDSGDENWPVISLTKNSGVMFHQPNGEFEAMESSRDLIECSKYDDFKDGDKVMVSSSCLVEYKRYFAYEKDGCAYCYQDGSTKWTSDGIVTIWENCRKATDDDR